MPSVQFLSQTKLFNIGDEPKSAGFYFICHFLVCPGVKKSSSIHTAYLPIPQTPLLPAFLTHMQLPEFFPQIDDGNRRLGCISLWPARPVGINSTEINDFHDIRWRKSTPNSKIDRLWSQITMIFSIDALNIRHFMIMLLKPYIGQEISESSTTNSILQLLRKPLQKWLQSEAPRSRHQISGHEDVFLVGRHSEDLDIQARSMISVAPVQKRPQKSQK